MNITRIGNTTLTIACKTCGAESVTPFASITVTDEHTMVVPCSTPGCSRVTFVPRQRDTDNPAEWAWEHNRAMNFAFQKALAGGAKIKADAPPAATAKLVGEKAAGPKKRFAAEEWRAFTPAERVKSVAEEIAEG